MPGKHGQCNDVLVCTLSAASVASAADTAAAVAPLNPATVASPRSTTSVCTHPVPAATLSTAAFAASAYRTACVSIPVHTAISSFTLLA